MTEEASPAPVDTLNSLFVLPADDLVEAARAWVADRRSALAPFPEPSRQARPDDVDVLRSLALPSQANSLSLQLAQGCAFVGTPAAPEPAGSVQWCAWHLARAIEERDPAKIAAAYGTSRAVAALIPLAMIGLKVRNGGRRGAAVRTAERAERLESFALASLRNTKLSERALANAIARAEGLTPEAVRAQLRRASGKKWGKPSHRPTKPPESST